MKEQLIYKQISTCFRSIRNLLYFSGVMGTGFASTIGYANAVTNHLGVKSFNAILIIELLGIGAAILLIFIKFVKIEALNLKEHKDG